MTYSVDLFTGRNVFQKDYANVLQFDTEQDRDTFFDSQDKLTFDNTEFVHVSNDSTNITVTFSQILDPSQEITLDLAKFTYCRINYELATPVIEERQQKSHYYFIDRYRIISSTTDRTVVRFFISEDIWTNYQFSFLFMPTLVERKHCDRWFRYSGDRYLFNVYPNRDRLVQMNDIFDTQELEVPKLTVKVCTSVETSARQEVPSFYYTVTPTYEEKEVSVVWALIQFTNNYNQAYDQQQFAIVPIQTEGFDFVPHHPQWIQDYIVGQIQADSVDRTESHDIGHYEMKGSCFLTLAMLESQGQSLILRDEDDYAVTINGIQILPTLPCTSQVDLLWYDGTGVCHIGFNSESLFLVEKSFRIEQTQTIPAEQYAYRYYFKQWVTDSLERLETVIRDVYGDYKLSQVDLGHFTPTVPAPPTPGGQADISHEPMMYFEPVMTRTIMTRDGQQSTQVPDVVFTQPYSMIEEPTHYELHMSMTFQLSASRCEITYYVSVNRKTVQDIVNDMKQQVIGITLKQKSYLFDILNDTYADYCVRQRDIDRRMMYMNILTGGVQESGSTAVSQGIGYRSNMERQKKEGILNSYDTGELANTMRSDDLARMYKGYQSSQAYMSQVGGLQQFSSNAIGQTASYEQLQKQMINSSSIVSNMSNWQDQIQNRKLGVVLIETVQDQVQKHRYYELFTKYGYQVNSVQIPELKTRRYFDYIKTGGQVLQTEYNQHIQAQLCQIFDNGVTIWHMDNCQTQDFIFNHAYEYDNTERSLLTEGDD